MKYSLSILLFSLLFLVSWPLKASLRSSEIIRAQKGLFRLLSADINEAHDYHFRTSVEYFQDEGLLSDADNSTVTNTKATLGFGYALLPYLHLSAHGGFNIASSQPEPGSIGSNPGTESIDLFKSGAAVVGTYDLSPWLDLNKNRFVAGLSVWIDFSKISRFIKGMNVIPTLILTGDFEDHPVVPFRAHLNTGFRPANGGRYFSKTDTVTDFARFTTETINSWAITSGAGIEFPLGVVHPSFEVMMEYIKDADFSNTPKWVTAGLKGKPFPQKNIEVFGAIDIGLSSFDRTATGAKPISGPVPPWNVIVGFGIAQFGKRATEVTVDQIDYNNVKRSLAEKEKILDGLQRDIEYNTIQGSVVDAETKQPLSGVTLSFPETTDLKPSRIGEDGQFIRYFKALPQARILFSKDGYEPSSKFMALKPGERVNVSIELRKASGVLYSNFIASVLDEDGNGLNATITLTNDKTRQSFSAQTDSAGQVTLKIPAGSYRMEIRSSGRSPVVERLDFETGKTLLRSYTLDK